ncbi:SpoIIE family protein phosphatase, partial [Streptomyces sp. NPDC059454]|uniref:SpoIIE family protein phosphatase n=1 Tax=Streptomyces sp. NPDC059454 TaxID=3346836 RepID=UPI00367DE0B8
MIVTLLIAGLAVSTPREIAFSRLLPAAPALAAVTLAAQGQARIGGDFYEAAGTPYGVRLLIGDVRGKGLSAVGAASAAINCFREHAYDQPDLRAVIRRLQITMSRYSAA